MNKKPFQEWHIRRITGMEKTIKNAIKNQILEVLKQFSNGVSSSKLAVCVPVSKEHREEFETAFNELKDSGQVEVFLRLKQNGR